MADCARAGARGVVVISAGFAEVSAEGRAAQTGCATLVRGSGHAHGRAQLHGRAQHRSRGVAQRHLRPDAAARRATSACCRRAARSGLAILDHAHELEHRHLHLRLGGQQGRRLRQRPARVLGGRPAHRRHRALPRELRQPAAVRAPGARRWRAASRSSRSSPAARPPGSRAASSHSAALACLDVAVDALFEQAGVIRTETLEELFDVAALLATQPRAARAARRRW